MVVTQEQTPIEALLRRERLIVLAGLLLVTTLAWSWLLTGAGTGMSVAAMTTWQFPPPIHPSMVEDWSATYAILMFVMWWAMMIAMMTPSAAPMILLYGRAYRYEQKLGKLDNAMVPTWDFALGYLAAWAAFSVVATFSQWGLERLGLIHAMYMWSIDPAFSATLLIAAGAYQLTPLKNICLKQCRSPSQFLAENFRPGALGAASMGWKHGIYCLGCCWVLMALLFAGGIMNLVWIAGLSIFVLVEKIAPRGRWIGWAGGVAMIAAGLWIAGRAYLD